MDKHIQDFLATDDGLTERYQQSVATLTSTTARSEFEVAGITIVSYLEPILFAAGTQYKADLCEFEIISQTQGPHYLRAVVKHEDDEQVGTLKFPVLKSVHELKRYRDNITDCVKTNHLEFKKLLEMEAEIYLEVNSKHIDLKMNMPITYAYTRKTVEEFLALMEHEINKLSDESDKRFFGWRERGLHKQLSHRLERFGMEHKLTFE